MPTSGTGSTAVTYQELFDSNRENISLDPKTLKMSASRILQCAWANRYQLIENELYQPHPSLNAVYGVDFTIEPSGIATAENTYVNANVHIIYQSLDFIPGSGNSGVTIDIETSSKVYTVPGSAFAFSSGSTNAANSLGKDIQLTLNFAQISMRRFNLAASAINQAAWVGVINNINSAALVVPGDQSGYSWAEGTLLYTGFSLEQRYVGAVGAWLFNVTHKFVGAYSGMSHNQEFCPATGTWSQVTAKAGGASKYISGDLAIL